MAYASKEDLTTQSPVFSDTSYSDKVLLSSLETMANNIKTRLCNAYAIPISVPATATIDFSDNVSNGDTVTIGSKTYTFVTSTTSANDILIGSTLAISMANAISAVNEAEVGNYHADTTINLHAYAYASDSDAITLIARKSGLEYNNLTLENSATVITTGTFSGGLRTFDLLISLNVWLSTIQLLQGQARSNLSGGGGSKLLEDLSVYITEAYETIAKGKLYDTTGVERAPLSYVPIYAGSSYPFADTGDPVNWKCDSDREESRS